VILAGKFFFPFNVVLIFGFGVLTSHLHFIRFSFVVIQFSTIRDFDNWPSFCHLGVIALALCFVMCNRKRFFLYSFSLCHFTPNIFFFSLGEKTVAYLLTSYVFLVLRVGG